MTIYQCHACGGSHDSSEPGCPQTFAIDGLRDVPIEDWVGGVIRGLLLSIRHPEDRTGDRAESEEHRHAHHHGTDALRGRALAGICWLNPFEMACEGCGCGWKVEDPEASMRRWKARSEELSRDSEELQDWRIGTRLHTTAKLCESCRKTIPGMGQPGGPADPRKL